MAPGKFCRAILGRLRSKSPCLNLHGLPATPVSGRLFSSSLSSNQLNYIDYKLRQYQIKVDKSEARSQRLSKLARKHTTKICSIFRHNNQETEEAQMEGCVPSWTTNFSTTDEVSFSRRNALEVSEDERRRVQFEAHLARLHALFELHKDDVHASVLTVYGTRDEESTAYWSRLRNSGRRDRAIVVDTTNLEEAQHGVICLEATPLPKKMG